MALISLLNFINQEEATPNKGDIFVSKAGNSLLIGPKVTKNFCQTCFKKRILSSELREIIDYQDIKDKEVANKYLTQKRLKDVILEVAENKMETEHWLIQIPGCKHSK